jgi:hypothetical protein
MKKLRRLDPSSSYQLKVLSQCSELIDGAVGEEGDSGFVDVP